jgi:hypothetical protein
MAEMMSSVVLYMVFVICVLSSFTRLPYLVEAICTLTNLGLQRMGQPTCTFRTEFAAVFRPYQPRQLAARSYNL